MAFKNDRKKVEELIYTVMSKIEPSKRNAEKYKQRFNKMSDKEFLSYFKDLGSDFNNNFYMEIDLYDKEAINFDTVERAAKHLNLPLEEHVTVRHLGEGDVVSPFPVPVFYIHLKRMQQILSKKNRINTDIMKASARSKLSGSLGNNDKTGRLTDADTMALLTVTNNTRSDADRQKDVLKMMVGAKKKTYANIEDVTADADHNYIIKEILGSRADNMTQKLRMSKHITLTGSVAMDEIEGEGGDLHTGQALNTLDVFLIGAGLKSDVISSGLETKQAMITIRDESNKLKK